MSLFPDDPIERCGYSKISLPKDHPFQPACEMHDRLFLSRELGFKTLTRKEADRALLRSMLIIARERKSASLKAQAYLYYAFVRVFGVLAW